MANSLDMSIPNGKRAVMRSTLFRLYYLLQSPTKGGVREESLIAFLYYICPIMACLLTTLTMAENFVFNADSPMLFFYRELP